MSYLHEKKISHRDIKPENLMLYKQGDLSCVKIIDFGLSKDFTTLDFMQTPIGSPYYIAPEVFHQKYDSKIDIWSLGVVLYIMLSGKVPFAGKTESEIIQSVLKGEYHFNHPAFDHVSDVSKDLIRKCLVMNSNARLSAAEALQHPFFASAGGQCEPLTSALTGLAQVLNAEDRSKQQQDLVN